MVTKELLSYIQSETEAGNAKDEIKLTLIQGGGWRSIDVDEAFARIEHPRAFKKQKRTHRRSSLLPILLVVLLIGGGYFLMQRYNVHSYRDMVRLMGRIKAHL